MSSCLILEGGGIRGAFTAGVLDTFLDEGIQFDMAIGTSAGSAMMCNFLAGQKGRSMASLLTPRSESFYGFREFLRSGKFLNLDKMYNEGLKNDPAFDFESYFKNPTKRKFVVSNCKTGKAEYLTDNNDEERFCLVGKASCALPIACRAVEVDGNRYMDGSMTDPIPVGKAEAEGYDKILFVTTKCEGCDPSDFSKWYPLMRVLYPRSYKPYIKATRNRLSVLDEEYNHMWEREKEGRAIIIAPTGNIRIGHLERDRDKISALYEDGRKQAVEMLPEIKEYLAK